MESDPIRVVLVEDHTILRQALRFVLDREQDIKVVAEGIDGESGVQKVIEYSPDVVVMDINLPGINGLQATKQIKDLYPQVKVLALTGYPDHEYVFGMLRAGADGYLLKHSAITELVRAIRSVYKGEGVMSIPVATTVVRELQRPGGGPRLIEGLTSRELEVLRQMAAGATSKAIAHKLGLSTKTVDNHRANIFAKLNVRNGMQAVSRAIELGLISPNRAAV